MTVTAASFVVDFPEFSNATKYPPSLINFWVNLAPNLLNSCRFTPTLIDFAVELMVAHGITLQARDIAAAAGNGTPGQNSGPIAGKGVGGVSVSYDTGAGTVQDAGWMNLTSYGTQLMGLINIAGMGGIQLGIGAGNGSLAGASSGNNAFPTF